MLFRFPDALTLLAAFRARLLPDRLLDLRARAGVGTDGVWLDLATRPGPVAREALERLGVTPSPAGARPALSEVESVLPYLPLEARPEAVRPFGEVLFRVPDGAALVRLSRELARLGRPAHRLFPPGGDGGEAWLSVADPPEFTLLADPAERQAWWRAAARVWLPWGRTHPYQERVRPPGGHSAAWLAGESAPWAVWPGAAGLPSVARFDTLPASPDAARWRDDPAKIPRVAVTFALRTAATPARPEAWWLDAPADAALLRFLEQADERDVRTLEFQRVQNGESDGVILRLLSGDRGPVLLPPGEAFRALARLDGVHAPPGVRLVPAVQRDVLRRALSPDGAARVWLGTRNGALERRITPPGGFVHLNAAVEYGTDQPTRRLTPARLADPLALRPIPPTIDEPGRGPKVRGPDVELAAPTPTALPPIRQHRKSPGTTEEAPTPEPELPTWTGSDADLLGRLRQLEIAFRDAPGALDDPARVRLWPALGEVYARLGDAEAAAVAWGNALWLDAGPAHRLAPLWAASEGRPPAESRRKAGRVVSVDALRAACADLVSVHARQAPAPDAETLQRFGADLESAEELIPVRLLWLTWVAVCDLAGGDVLALSRARDRLLERLRDRGLSADRDLVPFQRGVAFSSDAADRERMLRLFQRHLRVAGSGRGVEAFLRLVYAYGFAKQGLREPALRLVAEASPPEAPGKGRDRNPPSAQRWLLAAYRERVRQVLDGKSAGGPLSDALVAARRALPPDAARSVNRLFAHSLLLDPTEVGDPNRAMELPPGSKAARDLAELRTPAAVPQLADRFARLFAEHTTPLQGYHAVSTGLALAFRNRESFAGQVLDALGPALERFGPWLDLPALQRWVGLFELALGLAGHFERADWADGVLGQLNRMLSAQRGERAAWLVGATGGGLPRLLARLGRPDDAAALHERFVSMVLGKLSPADALKQPGLNRTVYVGALSRLAGGWFYRGDDARAAEALSLVRAELSAPGVSESTRAALLLGYLDGVGQGPPEWAMDAFDEVLTNVRTDASPMTIDYPLSAIEAAERLVRAVASEEFHLDRGVRRLLDEDEYLTRRRVHADTRAALGRAGV